MLWRMIPLLNLILPALLPIAGVMASIIGIGHPLWAMEGAGRTPVVPAPYAFSIWGPIFALALAYGIWQMRPAQRADPRLARLGGPVAAAFGLMILWMVVAQLTPNGWHLLAIMLGLLVAALVVFGRAVRLPDSGGTWRWLVRPLVGLLAGWVSAAAFVNLSGAALAEGFDWFGASPSVAAMCLVLLAAWVGTTVLRWTGGDLWYAVALLWALAAIIVANLGAPVPNVAVALVAALGMVMVAVATFLARRQPGTIPPDSRRTAHALPAAVPGGHAQPPAASPASETAPPRPRRAAAPAPRPGRRGG
jgi:hypothetical protein